MLTRRKGEIVQTMGVDELLVLNCLKSGIATVGDIRWELHLGSSAGTERGLDNALRRLRARGQIRYHRGLRVPAWEVVAVPEPVLESVPEEVGSRTASGQKEGA